MDWHVIEYDNKKFDSHVFMDKVQGEFVDLMTAAGGGPTGATVYAGETVSPDKKFRLYFNPKATSIPGVNALLENYRAQACGKPTVKCSIFAGNHAEPL